MGGEKRESGAKDETEGRIRGRKKNSHKSQEIRNRAKCTKEKRGGGTHEVLEKKRGGNELIRSIRRTLLRVGVDTALYNYEVSGR